MTKISQHDKDILRDLAKRQYEHATSEGNRKLKEEWVAHNDCRGERPMVHVELWTFGQEVVPPLLKCEGDEARAIEAGVYSEFINRELFGDDFPVRDYIPVHYEAGIVHYGLEISRTHAEASDGNQLGHRFNYHINDLEADFHKLGPSQIRFAGKAKAESKVKERIEMIGDLVGDIIQPKPSGHSFGVSPTQNIVHIMGMETMFMSMYDYPDLFHKMMRQFADDTIEFFRFMEKENLLLPTTANESLAQGSWCFTEELPSEPKDGTLKSTSLWGYMDSQETVGLSPEMFGEFIFPYYKDIAENFGLLSYGCCEPVHSIWDDYLSQLTNIRKVSVSPWCDEPEMAEKLAGKKIIYHRKPSPNFLGTSGSLDENAVREHIRPSIIEAKKNGLKLEISQRDVYTIDNDVSRVKRYIEIIREEIASNW